MCVCIWRTIEIWIFFIFWTFLIYLCSFFFCSLFHRQQQQRHRSNTYSNSKYSFHVKRFFSLHVSFIYLHFGKYIVKNVSSILFVPWFFISLSFFSRRFIQFSFMGFYVEEKTMNWIEFKEVSFDTIQPLFICILMQSLFRTNLQKFLSTTTHTHSFIYICVCVMCQVVALFQHSSTLSTMAN